MTFKNILTLLLIILVSNIAFGQNNYDKFIQAILKGDTILAQRISDESITTELIETKSLPIKNVPSHSFKISLDKLKDTITSLFNFENQYNNKYLNNIFYYYPSKEDEKERHKMFIDFQVETKTTALFGTNYYEKPNTSNDIYIHNFGTCWNSKLYFSKKKPLKYRTAFIIKLTKINDDSTKLFIEAEAPKVINGTIGLGAHGPIARETAVEPTTIEEYSILLFIADKLGDKSLIPLKLPTDK